MKEKMEAPYLSFVIWVEFRISSSGFRILQANIFQISNPVDEPNTTRKELVNNIFALLILE